MEQRTKYLLLALYAPLLAATAGVKPGHAFDAVNWQWNVEVAETVTKTVGIDVDLSPTGMIFLEQNQIFVGSVSADSIIDGTHNLGMSGISTEDYTDTTSEWRFVDVDFDAQIQVGAGNNDGANPLGAARYGTDAAFADVSLAGAQSHLALYALLQNNPDSIDYEKSFVDEATSDFEIYAYFSDLDLYAEIKGYYDDCTPGGANCMPTGEVELYRLSDDEKVFIATGTLSQQNGVDMVNTAGPGGEVKLSADIEGAREWQEVFSQITSQRRIITPIITDAMTDLPSVISSATAVANNSEIEGAVAQQLHILQQASGSTDGTEFADPTQVLSGPGGELGLMSSGNVSSISTVADVLYASVRSAATAIANNQQVRTSSTSPTGELLLADITQFSFNKVNATSDVSGVTLNSYLNLGVIDRPLTVSTATAIGNNLGLTVNAGF